MSALPRTVCCALMLLACRHVGEGDASDTQDTLDSGETQHTAEDTGDDSDVFAVCVPDDGKIQVACPYTLPAEYQPVPYDTRDPNMLPKIFVRTGWWLPFDSEDDEDFVEFYLSTYKEDPSLAVGVLACCVPAWIAVQHAYGWVVIGVDGPSEDGTTCAVGIAYQDLMSYTEAWDVDIPDWVHGSLECDIPLPWDPPSWLYSSNSPLYGDIPSGCHPYVPQDGKPPRAPKLGVHDMFRQLRSRAVEAP